MTNADNKMFQEALIAIKAGNKQRGKDLLTRLIKEDQENAEYWLYMSAVVESVKERRYCLNQAIKLDPENKLARRGLMLLGDIPVDDSLSIPLSEQKRKWDLPPAVPVDPPVKIPWTKVALASAGLIAAIVLIVVAIRSTQLWRMRARELAAMATAMPTPTYPASPTFTLTVTPRILEPTAPWSILESTYTPTPIYVSTAHPIIEAYAIAMRNYQKEDWNESVRFFLQAIGQQGDQADLYYHLGDAYLRLGDQSDAETAFEQAINTDSNFAPGYYGRATINLLNNKLNKAIEDLLISVDLDNYYGEAYLSLVQAFIWKGDIAQAQNYVDDAEELLPTSPLVDLAKAEIALAENNFDLSISSINDALNKDLTLLDAYKLLGRVYQRSGNPVASLEPLKVFKRYNSSFDPDADLLLARAYAANNDYETAISILSSILERNSEYLQAYLQRGDFYTVLEKYQKAYEDYSAAFDLSPDSFDICMLLSNANFPLNNPGNAYEQASECQKFAESDQQLAYMYFVRALALEQLQNEVAQRDWERMLELDPNAILPEWKATAEFYLNQYYTPTPTLTGTPSPLEGSVSGTVTPTP